MREWSHKIGNTRSAATMNGDTPCGLLFLANPTHAYMHIGQHVIIFFLSLTARSKRLFRLDATPIKRLVCARLCDTIQYRVLDQVKKQTMWHRGVSSTMNCEHYTDISCRMNRNRILWIKSIPDVSSSAKWHGWLHSNRQYCTTALLILVSRMLVPHSFTVKRCNMFVL